MTSTRGGELRVIGRTRAARLVDLRMPAVQLAGCVRPPQRHSHTPIDLHAAGLEPHATCQHAKHHKERQTACELTELVEVWAGYHIAATVPEDRSAIWLEPRGVGPKA